MEVEDVREYEKQLLAFVRAEQKNLLDELNAANELTKDLEEKVRAALDAFKNIFKGSK